MNEEEKKTFKFLKDIYELNFKSCTLENIDIKNIVNIIEKQQKEIEKLKNFNKTTYIRKDTIRHIRDKAECMDYYSLNDVIDDLSKLLGE